jgi:uncharacterized protein DUF3175
MSAREKLVGTDDKKRALPEKRIGNMAKRTGRTANKRDRNKRKRWSARVTQHSNALDLEPRVFRSRDPRKVACSLKRSAQRCKRRKGTTYQSAMSMLNFYINRAGKNLPQTRKRVLKDAKKELRDVFSRK